MTLDRVETWGFRVLGAGAALLGATVLGRVVETLWTGSPDQSWQRLTARMLFGLSLLYIAGRSFRPRPDRAGKHRRKVLRLVAVLAREDLQRAYAESAPSTSLADALLDDWRSLIRRSREPAAAGAFDEAERSELDALDADLDRIGAELPVTSGAEEDVGLLGEHRAWCALRERSRRTHELFIARAKGSPRG